MPTYDFECVKCKHRFERKRSFSDNGSTDCPRCRSEARRLFTAVPVIFKGSGFYVTDHRAPGPGDTESKKEEKTENNKPEDKPEPKKADAKPATTGKTNSEVRHA